MAATQSSTEQSESDGVESIYNKYPDVGITADTVAEHFEANISPATAEKLAKTFGDDLQGLSSVLGPQLRDAGFGPGVVTALFHGDPDHKDQTIAHRHQKIEVGLFSPQQTLV